MPVNIVIVFMFSPLAFSPYSVVMLVDVVSSFPKLPFIVFNNVFLFGYALFFLLVIFAAILARRMPFLAFSALFKTHSSSPKTAAFCHKIQCQLLLSDLRL